MPKPTDICKTSESSGDMKTFISVEEDEEIEKTKAMLRLMCELNKGRRSGEKEGYVSASDVRERFCNKRQ